MSKRELRKEKENCLQKIRILDRKINNLLDQNKDLNLKWEQSEKEIISLEKRIILYERTRSVIKSLSYTPLSRKTLGDATAIICANDWHVEERVDSTTCNDLNEYNLTIAARRIEQLWKKSIYLLNDCRNASNIKDAVLWLGGDFITGYIHDELRESNYLSPTQAIRFIQSHIIGGIKYLLKFGDLDQITVICNVGNHGRTTQKMRVATSYSNSFEWLAYHNIADHFTDDKRVRFQISDGYHSLVNIQGWRFRFHHGHAIRYEGGVGGITIPVNKAIAQWNKALPADFDVFAHWHQFIRLWRWIGCGCLIGYNAYALQIKSDYQPPSQTFLVADKKRGLVFAEPIFVV